jgi:hypothetical protein
LNSYSERRRRAACAFAALLATVVACSSRDPEPSEAQIAARIEQDARKDIPSEDRHAAAVAMASDAAQLRQDLRATDGGTSAAAAASNRDAAISRECESLANEISALQRHIEGAAPGEQHTAEERAAMPVELAQIQSRHASLCTAGPEPR